MQACQLQGKQTWETHGPIACGVTTPCPCPCPLVGDFSRMGVFGFGGCMSTTTVCDSDLGGNPNSKQCSKIRGTESTKHTPHHHRP